MSVKSFYFGLAIIFSLALAGSTMAQLCPPDEPSFKVDTTPTLCNYDNGNVGKDVIGQDILTTSSASCVKVKQTFAYMYQGPLPYPTSNTSYFSSDILVGNPIVKAVWSTRTCFMGVFSFQLFATDCLLQCATSTDCVAWFAYLGTGIGYCYNALGVDQPEPISGTDSSFESCPTPFISGRIYNRDDPICTSGGTSTISTSTSTTAAAATVTSVSPTSTSIPSGRHHRGPHRHGSHHDGGHDGHGHGHDDDNHDEQDWNEDNDNDNQNNNKWKDNEDDDEDCNDEK